jgi:transcriptional regulator with XRE-family HTH domain
MSTINERFKAVRDELGLNQTEYGSKLGLKQGSVGDIERGKSGIGVSESVQKLLEIEYNVNLKWLETGVGNMFKAGKTKLVSAFDHNKSELHEVRKLLKENEELKVYKEKYTELLERYSALLEKVNNKK